MWQECQNWISKFAPILLLTLVACTVTYGQDVRTNYVPGTDFSKYHTYAWVDEVQGVPAVGGHTDQILDGQVKQAIDSQMAAKGFTKVANGNKPDLLIGFQLMIDREKQINGFGESWGGWGGGWGPWGGGGFGSFSPTVHPGMVGNCRALDNDPRPGLFLGAS